MAAKGGQDAQPLVREIAIRRYKVAYIQLASGEVEVQISNWHDVIVERFNRLSLKVAEEAVHGMEYEHVPVSLCETLFDHLDACAAHTVRPCHAHRS